MGNVNLARGFRTRNVLDEQPIPPAAPQAPQAGSIVPPNIREFVAAQGPQNRQRFLNDSDSQDTCASPLMSPPSFPDYGFKAKSQEPPQDQGPPAPEPTRDQETNPSEGLPDMAESEGEPELQPRQAPSPPNVPDDQAQNIDRLERARGLAESLGNIRIRTTQDEKRGAPEPPRFKAEGIREAIAREHDKATPAEAAQYQALGINVQPGQSLGKLKGIIPLYGANKRAEAAAYGPGGPERMAQADERIGLAKRNADLRERSVGQGDVRLGRPPAKQQEEALALARSEKYLDLVEKDYEGVKDAIGPIYGRIQNVIRSVGYGDPQVAQLMANLRDAAGDYLTLKTGAQRGVPEIQFLMKALPDVTDANAPFEALLQSWRDRITIEKEGRKALSSTYGYKDPFGNQPATGGKKSFQVGGETFDIPAEKVKAFMAEHPDATETK